MLDDGDAHSLPAWMEEQAAIDRVAVWSAAGLMVATSDLDDTAALARLHASAHSDDLTLDDAATRLLERQLPLQDVTDRAGPPQFFS